MDAPVDIPAQVRTSLAAPNATIATRIAGRCANVKTRNTSQSSAAPSHSAARKVSAANASDALIRAAWSKW